MKNIPNNRKRICKALYNQATEGDVKGKRPAALQ